MQEVLLDEAGKPLVSGGFVQEGSLVMVAFFLERLHAEAHGAP